MPLSPRGSPRERPASKLAQSFGRIHFLGAVRLGFLQSCWAIFRSWPLTGPLALFSSLASGPLALCLQSVASAVHLLLLLVLLLYFWPCRVFVASRASLSLRRVGTALLQPCAGFSLCWLLLLQSGGSRSTGFNRRDAWA